MPRCPLPFHSADNGYDLVCSATLQRLEIHRQRLSGEWAQPDSSSSETITILEEAKRHPSGFRKNLFIESSGEIVRFESCLDPWQRADFEALDEAWMSCAHVSNRRPLKRRGYLERPRGHSKTTDVAVMVLWALVAAPVKIVGYAAAASEEQAELIVQSAERIQRVNPWLSGLIKIQSGKIINTETGSTCTVVPAKANVIYGQAPNFVIADELTHWTDRSVWSALYSGTAKVPTSIAVVISNAGYGKGRSWQWKEREKIRQDPAWYFASLKGPQATWLSQEDLEEQRRVLEDEEYQRLWLNRWLSDTKGGITFKEVQEATTLSGPATNTLHGCDFVIGGLDVGIKHDRTSLVWIGGNSEKRKLRLLGHRTWRPAEFPGGRVDLATVENAIIEDYQRLGVNALYADDWQAISTLQRLGEHFRCFEVNFSSARVRKDMARLFEDAFRSGWIELFYDEVLEGDLLSMEIVRHEHSRTKVLTAEQDEQGHADSGFALAIAILRGWDWLEALSRGAYSDSHEFYQVEIL